MRTLSHAEIIQTSGGGAPSCTVVRNTASAPGYYSGDPKTGQFTWRPCPAGNTDPGCARVARLGVRVTATICAPGSQPN